MTQQSLRNLDLDFPFGNLTVGKGWILLLGLLLQVQITKASWTNEIWMSKKVHLVKVRSNGQVYM